MAKPTKHAAKICLVLSIIVVLGALIGLLAKSPLVLLLALTGSVLYQVYRTEGETTRWASRTLLAALVLEFVLVIFGVSFDLAAFLGASERTVAGYQVPIGDIKLVGPAVMAVCAMILLVRTRGRYTRWLSVNILVGTLALAYVLDPVVFQELVRSGVDGI
ncbi:MAG: hypothetical protein KKA32_12040 [Actinobacteria bacterium]|nr:hypothetical protein [Actinomycetota bacterium]